MTTVERGEAHSFYSDIYRRSGYADFRDCNTHFAGTDVSRFVSEFRLETQHCLEVGCGRGVFQDVVEDYTGVDLSPTVAAGMHKPFLACDATELPFDDGEFDACWSITVLEHIPDPEAALAEMRRVLRPGGLLFLKVAWHCRSWICEGIPVRPYRDLTWWQRWVKLTLPIRNSLLLRAASVLPRRLLRGCFGWGRQDGSRPLPFAKLEPNYETFWMVDSDAAVSLDSFDVIQWFRQQGDDVLSHPTFRSAVLSRSEPVIIRVHKS
ncbi:MAG: class I SAM-dependent methyltransferase [Planctomycetaceae bacterium]